MTYAWYVAQTKPNMEQQVVRRLDDQDFTTYCPFLTVRRGIHIRQEPLFRSYVFISLELDEERWKDVTSTKAITHLLPRSDAPLAVSTMDVEMLKKAEIAGFFRSGRIAPGDRVKVFRGKLAGQVLECIESGEDRLRALWSCMNRSVVVDLATADVSVER